MKNAFTAPKARPTASDYVALAGHIHSPQTLSAAFGLHEAFSCSGDMRKVDWSGFSRKGA